MHSAYTAASIAAHLGGELLGPGEVRILGAQSLDDAGRDQITFITDLRSARRWNSSAAGAAVVTRGVESSLGEREQSAHGTVPRPLIVVPDADIAMVRILELFHPGEALPEPGVHPTAYIHPEATLGGGVRIGPHVSVDRGAVLGSDVVLHAGVRLYAEVRIGDGSILHANAVVRERCVTGKRVILHQGASIGADGFGYRPIAVGGASAGDAPFTLLKMPHVGNVVIGDDVEIGANACIDRGKFGATVIGSGTKLDNLVQIGHNCRIGRSCVIAGMAGLAGSVTVGDGVQIGAQAGISEHVKVGDGAKIAAQSGVMRDVGGGEVVFGTPALPRTDTLRQIAALRKLPGLLSKIGRFADQNQMGGNE